MHKCRHSSMVKIEVPEKGGQTRKNTVNTVKLSCGGVVVFLLLFSVSYFFCLGGGGVPYICIYIYIYIYVYMYLYLCFVYSLSCMSVSFSRGPPKGFGFPLGLPVKPTKRGYQLQKKTRPLSVLQQLLHGLLGGLHGLTLGLWSQTEARVGVCLRYKP